MLHEQYYVELDKYNKLIARKNVKSDHYNGIYDRYQYPVLTREHIPLHWRYDLNPETNPYFMERLGINAVMNSGAIELNGKYYLVARIEGNDRKSFFGVAESDNGIDGFRFWDYPILLPDTCPEETNVYDMRLTKHEDGYIYGVFCSESKDTTVNDLSAAVAAAGIVRTKDLKNWERLPNLVTKRSPQQRNVVLRFGRRYRLWSLRRYHPRGGGRGEDDFHPQISHHHRGEERCGCASDQDQRRLDSYCPRCAQYGGGAAVCALRFCDGLKGPVQGDRGALRDVTWAERLGACGRCVERSVHKRRHREGQRRRVYLLRGQRYQNACGGDKY